MSNLPCVCSHLQVASYMRAVNDVYDKVDFDGIKLVNFKVKSLRVRTLGPKAQQVILSTSAIRITFLKRRIYPPLALQVMTEEDTNDRLSRLYIGPEKLLSLFSENDWSQFCLSYLLTDRDYSGVLGLAWEGKAGESHRDAYT